MKRLLIFLLSMLALCLLCAGAGAESRYRVLPAEMDEAALLQLCFGESVSEARREVLEDGQLVFDLPGTDGAPFCSYSTSPVQTGFNLFGTAYPEGEEELIGSDNVWPGGIAECALTREAALAQAEAMMQLLHPGEYALQSVTAYGRIPGYRDEYCIAYLQRLNGRAVYWSANIRPDGYAGANALWLDTNRVQLQLDDHGLVRMDGAWCRYEPTGEEFTPMDEAQAIAALAASGIQADAPELCYYLQYGGQSADALPAWRSGNHFLDARDGTLLQ